MTKHTETINSMASRYAVSLYFLQKGLTSKEKHQKIATEFNELIYKTFSFKHTEDR